MPATVFNGARIVIEGDKFASLGMGATYEGAVKLDPATKPKAFDLLFTAGHAKGHRNLGIYKLDDDTWTICLATRGNQRPGKFATRPGTGFALETLERGGVTRKSGKQKSQRTSERGSSGTTKTAPSEAGAVTELEGEWAMISAILNGVAMNQAMVKWCQRITRGNVSRVVAGPQVFVNVSFTLDNSKKPHVIDYLNLEGASEGESQAGIFELIGDSLKICMSAPGHPRPADFSSKPGDGRSYTTWRLVRK
ncbi:MAG TPA: TIGR03067 domain-containing protein, partial [Pyrinomonadaceae bacterium]